MKQPTRHYLLGLAVAVAAVVFLVLGAGALGIIGAGESDRLYLAVLAVGLVGAALSRLRSIGMAWTLAAMALAQVVVPLVAFGAGLEGTQDASVVDVVGLTAMYAGLFCVAAWLFLRAARESGVPRTA
jgi:hypothetical protein